MDEPKNRIAYWRKERGLTRAQLAALIGLGHTTLSRIEAGQITPSAKALAAISSFLGVPVGELLAGAMEPDVTITPEVSEMLKRVFDGGAES